MKANPRPILSLPGRSLVDAAEDRSLQLTVYDVLLPCRRFHVDHKVAVLGRVSLTAEFLLRLLRSMDGFAEEHASAFFGFDRREMSFVLGEVHELGYVDRRDGRLWLTMQGHSLFRDNSSHPEIFEVEKRTEVVGFDLISLAPQDLRGLARFERWLPELQPVDTEQVSHAARRIPNAFRRFYPQLVARRDQIQATKRSLYSIDRVTAGERFLSPIRLVLKATALHPSMPDLDLDEWRPPHEQDDRPEVLTASSVFKDKLVTSKRPDDKEGYQFLLDLAPGFLKDFARADGLAVERYYREALIRAGEPRSDRPTVPLLGSLFLEQNVRRLTEVLGYGLKARARPGGLLWAVPQVPYWGATSLLPGLLRQLVRSLGHTVDQDGRADRAFCLVAGKEARYLDEAFGHVQRTDAPVLPRCLEILLLPGILAAVTVHAPIGSNTGLPVPLGFISFDLDVIGRATDTLLSRCGRSLPRNILDLLRLESDHDEDHGSGAAG